MPIDPKDLGRNYESVIRVNSQSGKGGIAYLLERDYGIVMPRRMQVEFSSEVQKITDETETEITSQELFTLFEKTYLTQSENSQAVSYRSHKVTDQMGNQMIEVCMSTAGRESRVTGKGNGPLDATMDALRMPIEILNYEERSMGAGANAKAITIIEMANENGMRKYGVGIDGNIVSASIKAIFSAINRF